MAGKLLNTLKGSGTKPAASHEARLGMMVITILVFAFGFLVYHKMDMHQRQLTQASIAPNVSAPSPEPVIDAAAALHSQNVVGAVTDPVVNIEDLSDGSPFSEPATGTMDLTPGLGSNAEQFLSLDEPASPEPAFVESETKAATSEPAFVFDEPVQLEELAAADEPVIAADEPVIAANEPVIAANEPVIAANEPMIAANEPVIAANEPMIAMAEPPVAEGDFFLDREVPEPVASLPPIVAGPPDAFEPDIELDDSFLSLNSASEAPTESLGAPSLEVEKPTSGASGVADNAFDLPVPEPTFEPADGVKISAEEPVLLALAEPQQENEFGDGFLLEETTSSESPRPAVDEPAGFSAFPNTEAEPQPVVRQQRQASESRGFNAVKNPGRRSDGQTIRTAAGSGSDGKFSLAAFNYQNGASQAAPDDGSTFNSVVVQNGDNYTKISKRVYGSVKYFSALAVFNQHRIPEPKNMRPGMVVLVPEKKVLEERYPELFADSQPKVAEIAEFFLLEDGSPAYRVGERETISQIAERFLGRSSRWIEIYRLNQSVLKDPNKLKAGLILALPADATEVNVVP